MIAEISHRACTEKIKKKVSLDTWIQLLGMIGLLGGLVFVGLELQQNQTNASASQVQARTNNTSDVFIAPMDG